jgi:hypothetical protein
MATAPSKDDKNQTDSNQGSEIRVRQPEPEKVLMTWESPVRLYKKRDREYFTTIGVIVILLSVILLFAKEFLLVGVILSFAFVSYTLASIPPPKVKHEITNKGVRSGSKLYLWETLGRFWFEEKWKQDTLMIENFIGFPGRLSVILSDEVDKKQLEEEVSARLIKEQPSPSPIDKAAQWISDKVPLETK